MIAVNLWFNLKHKYLRNVKRLLCVLCLVSMARFHESRASRIVCGSFDARGGGNVGGRVHKRFREVRSDLVPTVMTENQPVTVRIPLDSMEKLPELKVKFNLQ